MLLTEAADKLKINPATLRRWIKAGYIAGIKRNRRYYVDLESIRNYIAICRHNAKFGRQMDEKDVSKIRKEIVNISDTVQRIKDSVKEQQEKIKQEKVVQIAPAPVKPKVAVMPEKFPTLLDLEIIDGFIVNRILFIQKMTDELVKAIPLEIKKEKDREAIEQTARKIVKPISEIMTKYTERWKKYKPALIALDLLSIMTGETIQRFSKKYNSYYRPVSIKTNVKEYLKEKNLKEKDFDIVFYMLVLNDASRHDAYKPSQAFLIEYLQTMSNNIIRELNPLKEAEEKKIKKIEEKKAKEEAKKLKDTFLLETEGKIRGVYFAKIVGTDPDYGLKRKFLGLETEYDGSDIKVYGYFKLAESDIIEEGAGRSWSGKNVYRYRYKVVKYNEKEHKDNKFVSENKKLAFVDLGMSEKELRLMFKKKEMKEKKQ